MKKNLKTAGIIVVVALLILFLARTIYYSFTDYNMLTDESFIGFENYLNLKRDFVFGLALKNTIFLCLANALSTGGISILIAIASKRFIKKAAFLLPVFALAVSIASILGVFDGIIFKINTPLLAALCILCFCTFGFAVLTQFIPYERAGIKAPFASYIRVFTAFVLPVIFSALLVKPITRITGFPSADYKAHTITAHIMDYKLIRFQIGYSSALTVINLLVIVCLTALIIAIMSIVCFLLKKAVRK